MSYLRAYHIQIMSFDAFLCLYYTTVISSMLVRLFQNEWSLYAAIEDVTAIEDGQGALDSLLCALSIE